jgi:hypothetical protein
MAKIVTFGKSSRSRLPHHPWSIWKTLTKQGVTASFQPGVFLASNGFLETLQIDKPYASDCSTLLL